MSDDGRPEDAPAVEPSLEPDVDLARGEARLAAAARQLRSVPSAHAEDAAGRVLRAAFAAPRKTDYVRVAAPHDHVRVSTLVVVATVRERLDAALDGAAVSRVRLEVDREERLVAGTVELYVRYGTVIADVAARAQVLAAAAVDDLLGGPDASRRWDVHVSDVTVGDPHHVDPVDELAAPQAP